MNSKLVVAVRGVVTSADVNGPPNVLMQSSWKAGARVGVLLAGTVKALGSQKTSGESPGEEVSVRPGVVGADVLLTLKCWPK